MEVLVEAQALAMQASELEQLDRALAVAWGRILPVQRVLVVVVELVVSVGLGLTTGLLALVV
jgi:hypothetical protein